VTAVTCTATDGSDNKADCTFFVTIRDLEEPVITCPPDMTVTAYAPTGTLVNYPPPAVTDNCGVLETNCTPPSGSVFPLGITPVACVATDTSGNESRCQFDVTVGLIGIELDRFDYSLARITVQSPLSPEPEVVTLAGPTEVEVYLDPNTGRCADLDGDGLDQALAQMTRLDLVGNSTMGLMHVRLWSARPTWGEVEERDNFTREILDLPPFLMPPVATYADSFFDVWVEVELPGPVLRLLHSAQPVRMVSVLAHKPPAIGEAYTNRNEVELVDALGQPSGIVLKQVIHIPNPENEIDHFPVSESQITVMTPQGAEPVTLVLWGPTTVEVAIPPDGWAADTDGNGRDQAPARMTQLDVQGSSPLGPAIVRLDPSQTTLGLIEEQANLSRGLLDLPPFVTPPIELRADSFFDVFFTIELGGLVLHPAEPVRMQAVLSHKPPAPGEAYTNRFTRPIQLLLPDGTPSEFELIREVHIPVPLPCGALHVELVPPLLEPAPYDVMVCWKDDGRCRLQWTRELSTPIAWNDWTGPILVLPDGTNCVRLANPKDMMCFRLCGGCVQPQ
jgi:hypothetical protein